MSKKITKGDLFLELAQPDQDGFSKRVPIEKFVGKYQSLQLGNGGGWCRSDGPLGQKYNIHRIKEKNKITAIELHGFNKNPIKKPIPSAIKKQITALPCVVLGIHARIEVDHKDGRLDDPRLTDPDRVNVDDFQPLSKSVNNAKRQHCKRCRETDERFDAKTLGYPVSQVKGDGKYRGSCIGCYWYSPKTFNASMTHKENSE